MSGSRFRAFLPREYGMLIPGDGMTVYIDQVWLLNSLVDYLLLSVSGQLLGQPRRQLRLLLAGAAGGLYAALSLVPGMGFLQGNLCRAVSAGGLCLCAFGQARGILRQTAVLFLLAAAFSGITLLLTECFSAPGALIGGTVYYPLSLGVLILTAGGATGMMSWGLGRLMQHGGDLTEVELTIAGKTKTITALYDTGNTLKDPISGVAVLVADWTLLRDCCPGLHLKQSDMASPEALLGRLYIAYPELNPRLLSYKTISSDGGMLLAVRPEKILIQGRAERMLIAFSPVTVSDGGGYQALLGGKR